MRVEFAQRNGIKFVFIPNPGSRSLYLNITSAQGSVHENAQNNGITHFLEHMIFKGSRRFSYRDINNYFEINGNSIDAYTTKESLTITTTILPDAFEGALEIISSMIEEPAFLEKDIENEKMVVLQEYNELMDAPNEVSYINLYRIMFDGHPLAYEVLGSPETIRRFDREMLRRRLREVFSRGNVVVAMYGKIPDYALDYIHENLFLYDEFTPNVPPLPPYKPSMDLRRNNSSGCYVSMGIPLQKYDKDKLMVVNSLLGAGMSSLLFEIIREEKGLVYDIHSFVDVYKHVALFGIYFAAVPENCGAVLEEIRAILQSISERDIESAKRKVVSSLSIDWENPISYVSALAWEFLQSGVRINADDIIERVKSFSRDDLMDHLERISRFHDYSISVVGEVDAFEGLRV